MKNSIIPPKGVVLLDLQPVFEDVYAGAEGAFLFVQDLFARESWPMNEAFFTDAVRFRTWAYLSSRQEVTGFTLEPLTNNGICVLYANYRVRFLKSICGSQPPPKTHARQLFYANMDLRRSMFMHLEYVQNQLPFAAEDIIRFRAPTVDLVVVWEPTPGPHHLSVPLTLICPKKPVVAQVTQVGAIDAYWQCSIPHPALSPAINVENPVEEDEDLDADDLPYSIDTDDSETGHQG